MLRALVAVASRHGSTREIAEAIAGTLRDEGLDVVVSDSADVTDVSGYDAVVLGSAVYVGRWLEPARALVDEHGDELAARPTWLFSSGPIGDPPKPEAEDAVQISEIAERVSARDHRLFAGKLDRSTLGFGERAVVLAFRAPEGDFRDWDEIAGWARGIAAALRA
jgi:menaquinone-dependent protoporphyrinogen oxidase